MSILLFLDESGHDHKNAPYEIRGGIALRAERLWPFVRDIKRLEVACFGVSLHRYQGELKGHRLLDRHRFQWANQESPLEDLARRKYALSFLNKGVQKQPPTRMEFTAYGQACIEMVRGVFETLHNHGARIFAVAIPRSVEKPATFQAEEYLRKDFVFLLERFFYFLEEENETGLLVMDQTDQAEDRRFVVGLERYFTRTQPGLFRTARIVPSPFFVSSDMAYPVQIADVCIYCINHAFRLPSQGMDAPTREEVKAESLDHLFKLQWKGQGSRDGKVFDSFGIAFVPDPYSQASQ